jgi:hypothetical protein
VSSLISPIKIKIFEPRLSKTEINPIKIKIIDLNIIFAALSGAVARVAFYCKLIDGSQFIINYGKLSNSIKNKTVSSLFITNYGKTRFAFSIKTFFKNSISMYNVLCKQETTGFLNKLSAMVEVSNSYLPLEKIGIGINKISDVVITKISHKKIRDITGDTIGNDIIDNMTIFDLMEQRSSTRAMK